MKIVKNCSDYFPKTMVWDIDIKRKIMHETYRNLW